MYDSYTGGSPRESLDAKSLGRRLWPLVEHLAVYSKIWAVCCSVLQCVAVCGNVLRCDAGRCSALQCVSVCCNALQCVAVCCSVLQCVSVFSFLKRVLFTITFVLGLMRGKIGAQTACLEFSA